MRREGARKCGLSKQEIKNAKTLAASLIIRLSTQVAGLSALPRSTRAESSSASLTDLTWAVGSRTVYEGLGGGVNDNDSCTAQNAGELVCGTTGYDNVFCATCTPGC